MSTAPFGESDAHGFQRRLGLFDCTMLVAGTMIGSGIFIVSADIARDVGSSGWLLLIWVLTGVMTLMGALSYAELAGMMPHAGGQYVYLREAYSPLWGFLYGWALFLVIQTGFIAAVSVAFAKFLGVLVPRLGTGEEAVLYKLTGLDINLTLSLPWLQKPLTVFKRTEFTVTGGQLVAVVVVVVLTAINCRGVREGKWVQNLFTIAKMLALLTLIVLGLTIARNPAAIQANLADLWEGATDTPRFDEVKGLVGRHRPDALIVLMVTAGAMVGALFSADAWNYVTFTAGETKNPHRNLPLSLLFGTGLVITLYVLANIAYLSALPVRGTPEVHAEMRQLDRKAEAKEKAGDTKALEKIEERRKDYLAGKDTFERGIAYARDDRVGTAVVERASPQWGVTFIALTVIVSTFGCVNGLMLMGARLYYAMARDRVFFRAVGTLNWRGVPAVGLVLQALWSVLLIFSGTYIDLLEFTTFVSLLFYAVTVTGLFVLRRKRPDAERPYKAFGYPVVPALYVVLCAGIMLNLLVVRPRFTWPGLIIVLSGIPVYFLWRLFARRPA
jgi:basic amino acid/polyamine antiporter, APA family